MNWNSDESRTEWLVKVKELWKKSLKDSTEFSLENFISFFTLFNPPRPVLWRDMSQTLNRVWAAEVDRDYPHPEDRKKIKNWADKKMRDQAEEDLYEPGQAPAFPRDAMREFWLRSRESGKPNRMVGAIVSYICFMTGARTGEISALFIQDLRWKERGPVTFLQMPLRTSKSNASKERREVVTMPITPQAPVPIKDWILEQIGTRTHGNVFKYLSVKGPAVMDTKKMNYYYSSQAEELNWEIYPTGHSMRVSFVIESVMNGVPSEHIQNCCRWQSEQMVQLYKNNHLEHTMFGSSFRVTTMNENPNAVPQRAWEEDSTAPLPTLQTPSSVLTAPLPAGSRRLSDPEATRSENNPEPEQEPLVGNSETKPKSPESNNDSVADVGSTSSAPAPKSPEEKELPTKKEPNQSTTAQKSPQARPKGCYSAKRYFKAVQP